MPNFQQQQKNAEKTQLQNQDYCKLYFIYFFAFDIRASENGMTTQVMIITTMYFKNATV